MTDLMKWRFDHSCIIAGFLAFASISSMEAHSALLGQPYGFIGQSVSKQPLTKCSIGDSPAKIRVAGILSVSTKKGQDLEVGKTVPSYDDQVDVKHQWDQDPRIMWDSYNVDSGLSPEMYAQNSSDSVFVAGPNAEYKLMEVPSSRSTRQQIIFNDSENDSESLDPLNRGDPFANETIARDLETIRTETEPSGKSRISMHHRSLSKRRNARSAEEGIQRAKLPQLSSLLLEKAKALDIQSPRYAARTIAGLVSALAEEVDDLDVEVVTQADTPFWDKQVDEVKITFSRLGFSPFKMGGLDQVMEDYKEKYPDSAESEFSKKLRDLSCADEAFKQIDVDNSGFVDRDELGEALLLASGAPDEGDDGRIIQELASALLELYDVNGDGVISRSEYQVMVEDMAALVKKQQEQNTKHVGDEKLEDGFITGVVRSAKQFVRKLFSRDDGGGQESSTEQVRDSTDIPSLNGIESPSVDRVQYFANTTESVDMIESMAKSLGSITLTDLKLDLRRLVFGAVPVIKHITPGGPLILEPFRVTITGSVSRDDIMKSSLLETGLSRLIGLVLRRRVRSLRDLTDLAVLFGRDYKLASKNAPVTEVMELSNVEFDDKNRLVMTGRAKVRTRPGAPTIDQAFKVRANWVRGRVDDLYGWSNLSSHLF